MSDAGKMSVRKFWVAGNDNKTVELTAETGQNALEPAGVVTEEDGTSLNVKTMPEGVAQTVRCAALCNVAT